MNEMERAMDMNPIPPALNLWLGLLSWAVVILALLWLLVWIFERLQRRRYNLTRVTVAEAKGHRPDFLRIDREKRAARIARGETYRRARETPLEPEPSGEETAPPPAKRRWAKLLHIVVLITALANVVAVSAGALLRIESTHEFFLSLTDLERWTTLLREYWIGFLVAVGVILGQIYRFGTLLFAPAESKKRADHARTDLNDDHPGQDGDSDGGD